MKRTEKIADYVAKSKDVTAYIKNTLRSGQCDNLERLQEIYDLAKEVIDNIYEFALPKLYNKWFDYYSSHFMKKWVKLRLEAPIDLGFGEVVDKVVFYVTGLSSAENGFALLETKGSIVYYLESGRDDTYMAVYPVIRISQGDVVKVDFDEGFLDRVEVVSDDYVKKLKESKLCQELDDRLKGDHND